MNSPETKEILGIDGRQQTKQRRAINNGQSRDIGNLGHRLDHNKPNKEGQLTMNSPETKEILGIDRTTTNQTKKDN